MVVENACDIYILGDVAVECFPPIILSKTKRKNGIMDYMFFWYENILQLLPQ